MSLAFNDTTTYRGIIQTYEDECGYNSGDVSGSTTLLKKVTALINLALDDFTKLAIQSSGTWQWDDSNQTDYPIITTNLVANQRDYSFTTDQTGNLILDIYKVFVADASGLFTEISPVDVQSGTEQIGTGRSLSSFTDGQNGTGTPTRYDKTANAIFLDPIPSANVSNGLKVYINREPSYFVSTDTTKKPGIPGIFHKYLALKPAKDYIRRNGNNNDYLKITNEVQNMEMAIQEYFSARPRDERGGFTVSTDSNM